MKFIDIKKNKYILFVLAFLFIFLICGVIYKEFYSFQVVSNLSYETLDRTLIDISFDYPGALNSSYQIKKIDGTMLYKDGHEIPVKKPYWTENILELLRKNKAISKYKKMPGVLVYDRFEKDTYFLPWNSEFVKELNSIIKDEEFEKEYEKYQNFEWIEENLVYQEPHETRRNEVFRLLVKTYDDEFTYDFYEDFTVFKTKDGVLSSVRCRGSFDKLLNQMIVNKSDKNQEEGFYVTYNKQTIFLPLDSSIMKEISDNILDSDFQNIFSKSENSMISSKTFYGSVSHTNPNSYYLVDDFSKVTDGRSENYSCKTIDCYIVNDSSLAYHTSWFLIFDSEYLLFDILSGQTKKLNWNSAEIKHVEAYDNYLVVYYKDQDTRVYDSINDKTILSYDKTLSIALSKNYLFVYSTLLDTHNTWKAYSVKDQKYVLDGVFAGGRGYIESYFINQKEYIVISPYDTASSPSIIFDENLNKVSDQYYFQGFYNENELVVTKYPAKFFYGGVKSSGYIDVFDYLIIDTKGNEIYKSKTYKSVQNFLANEFGEIKLFVAIDENNMLTLYDIAEKKLVEVEEWSEDKVFCFDKFSGFEVDFSVGLNQYRYRLDSKEIVKKVLDSPTCGAR